MSDNPQSSPEGDSRVLEQGTEAGIWYRDLTPPGREWANDRFWALLGYDASADQPDFASWIETVGPGELARLDSAFERHCRDESPSCDHYVRYPHADGSLVTVRCRSIAIRDAKGMPVRMLRVHTDPAADSRRAARFMDHVSHEMRTPLGGMLAIAEALRGTALSDRQAEMLDDLGLAGERLNAMLSDMLDIARIEAGEMRLDFEPFDPVALVHSVVDAFEGAGRSPGSVLSVDCDPDIARSALGSESRIRQVAGILMANAREAAPSGDISMAVAISQAGAEGQAILIVRITASGSGISGDGESAIVGQAGLGLPIAASLCALHGGSLEATGAPGGGARFVATFGVDVSDRRPPDADPASPDAAPPGLPENLSLLVAEDVLLNRRSLRHSLHGSSVVPTFATNGQQALAQMTTQAFDAALIDIRMPVMSGVELVRAYRIVEKREGRGRMPIVACSATVPGERIEGYAEAGFDGFLTKPFTFEQLVAALVKAGVSPR